MSSILVATKIKDPDSRLDYGFDLADWLNGDTIVSVSWTVPQGLTKLQETYTDTTVAVWISGGVVGQIYEMVCRFTTAAGRTDEGTYTIICREK